MACDGCDVSLTTTFATEGASIAISDTTAGDSGEGQCAPSGEACVEISPCDPYTQTITFTGNGTDRCRWMISPHGTSGLPGEEGQPIAPRWGFFGGGEPGESNVVSFTLGDLVTPDKIQSACGYSSTTLEVAKKIQTPIGESIIPIAQAELGCTPCENS